MGQEGSRIRARDLGENRYGIGTGTGTVIVEGTHSTYIDRICVVEEHVSTSLILPHFHYSQPFQVFLTLESRYTRLATTMGFSNSGCCQIC